MKLGFEESQLPYSSGSQSARAWTEAWVKTRVYDPVRSEDLTELIEQEGEQFVVLRSPETAEHDPDYEELGRFPTRTKAEEFLASYEAP